MTTQAQQKADDTMPTSPLPSLDTLIKSGVAGKRVLLRADLNVPIEHGKITDTTRIDRVVPTIQALSKAGAKVILLSHFGRPDNKFDPDFSLAPLTDTVSACLGGQDVKFAVDCIGSAAKEAIAAMEDGDVLLLENVRFHKGERANDGEFVNALAELADIYVNDAFSCSHREHASIVGLAKKLPHAAGYLLEKEVHSLESLLENPERPVAAIVGGAKVSTKIALLKSLTSKVDKILIGGGMANTFLAAQGKEVGKSLCEHDSIDTVKAIMAEAEKQSCTILLPDDVMVADELKAGVKCEVCSVDAVPKDKMILDIGPLSVVRMMPTLESCKTVIWNGPLGAFETAPFDVGTISVARILSTLTSAGNIKTVAGGGDILAALTKSGLRGTFSYLSTAGGAFLEWLEGKDLPGIKALKE